uniref:PIPK domain-containing protein n=1 Tax=Spongospora subterranea TaxID=70186 RepID=A0A0H5RRA3_9EUKA|eukprot:CRZ11249.1 hypothetical protein [Spongospora subterranea]
MGRRTRAVELVLGDVIEHAVSRSPDNGKRPSTIVHQATVSKLDDGHSSITSSILDNCQTVDSQHPQFDTSQALMHGIAHSFIPSNDSPNQNLDGDAQSAETEGKSSIHDSAVSIGRIPSSTNFKPIGNITIQQFREAVTQNHEVRYKNGPKSRVEPKDPNTEVPASPKVASKSIKFGFKSYAGQVFASLRSSLGITNEDYVGSLAGGESFHDFVSNSRSGAFFFFTTDGKYIIKTMSHNESLWFRDFLPGYFQHLHEHSSSLLVRIVGLYRIKFYGARNNLHFYVMLNVFARDGLVPIQSKFDLKGSTFGREAKSTDLVLKDVDFDRLDVVVKLGEYYPAVLAILKSDANFLSSAMQMDYSLLIGIYNRDQDPTNPTDDELLARLGYTPEEADNPSSYDRRGLLSRDSNRRIANVYFMGIIDYLQKYNWKKKTEHFFKAIVNDRSSISAVNPPAYAKRFSAFIERHLA